MIPASVTPIDLRCVAILSSFCNSIHLCLPHLDLCFYLFIQRRTMSTPLINSLLSFLLHYLIQPALLSILLIPMVQLLLLIHFACFETSLRSLQFYIPTVALSPL